jgi:hypothetical protein
MSKKARKYLMCEPDTGWRKRIRDFNANFTERDLDDCNTEIENIVYAMALDGASLTQIADYFAVSRDDLANAYTEVWKAGRAELQLMIAADTVQYGLESNIPVAKIWLGKAMGGLGEGTSTHTEADADSGSDVNVNIRVISKDE